MDFLKAEDLLCSCIAISNYKDFSIAMYPSARFLSVDISNCKGFLTIKVSIGHVNDLSDLFM